MASIKTPSGLTIEDLIVGTGDAASAGQKVSVHYTGWTTDGKKFDSSKDRGQAFMFSLGRGEGIRGWDEGVAGARHALIAQAQQALLQLFGQRRTADVETQVHCVRHLVDVLPAGALRAHGGQLDFGLRDRAHEPAHGLIIAGSALHGCFRGCADPRRYRRRRHCADPGSGWWAGRRRRAGARSRDRSGSAWGPRAPVPAGGLRRWRRAGRSAKAPAPCSASSPVPRPAAPRQAQRSAANVSCGPPNEKSGQHARSFVQRRENSLVALLGFLRGRRARRGAGAGRGAGGARTARGARVLVGLGRALLLVHRAAGARLLVLVLLLLLALGLGVLVDVRRRTRARAPVGIRASARAAADFRVGLGVGRARRAGVGAGGLGIYVSADIGAGAALRGRALGSGELAERNGQEAGNDDREEFTHCISSMVGKVGSTPSLLQTPCHLITSTARPAGRPPASSP